jgi:UDP-glucose 4-epimerase
MVVHLAAAVGVRKILSDPLSSLKTNVNGADNVLGACADYGKGVLLASTSEVYGKNEASSLCENADSILGSSSIERWSYAAAKKLDEFLGLAYHTTYGIPVIVTRFFNIVGPRQSARYGMVLPGFVRAALAHEPIRVFGDGKQSRNFTYIDDCVDALVALIGSSVAVGKIFNIGGAEEISIRELAERASPIVTVPYREAYQEGTFEDMRRRVPCICRIQALIGWTPVTSLENIIRNTVAHQNHADAAPEVPWRSITRLPDNANLLTTA